MVVARRPGRVAQQSQATARVLQTRAQFHSLQGSVGNRAVIRRYTVLKADADKRREARKSTSGKVVKLDAHRLYADKTLVGTANTKLKTVGGGSGRAAGAFLELVPMSEAFHGLPRITPVVVKRTTGLTTAQSPRSQFLTQGTAPVSARGEPAFVSPADCHVAAQSVMGSDDTPIGAYDTERPLMAGPGAPSAHFAPATEGGAHLANRAKHAFFARAMPAFADVLASIPTYKAVVGAIRAINPARVEFGVNNAYAAVYREHILPNAWLNRMFAKMFKVNEEAEPEIGRAFSNINDESQKVAMEKSKDIWNFHWAGVVLLDPPDYVTLENLSTEDINEINDKWYFQVYGSAGQSFHAESLRDPHATPGAVTLGFEATSQPAHPKVTFSPALNQKVVLGWMADPANDTATFAKFQEVRQHYNASPMDALESICKRLQIANEGDVRKPGNFDEIRKKIRAAISELNLPTASQPPVGGSKPVGAMPGLLPPPGPPGGVVV